MTAILLTQSAYGHLKTSLEYLLHFEIEFLNILNLQHALNLTNRVVAGVDVDLC